MVDDASVLTNALDRRRTGRHSLANALASDAHWAAPGHLFVQVFSAVLGRWLGQRISQRRAEDALSAMVTTSIEVVAAPPLLARMWELRNNVSG